MSSKRNEIIDPKKKKRIITNETVNVQESVEIIVVEDTVTEINEEKNIFEDEDLS